MHPLPVRFAPMTPGLIADLARLFGPQGTSYGCRCTYFRLRPKERSAIDKDEKRAVMEARIRGGPPPGLLAYQDGERVGWMQIGPRADAPEWNNPRRSTTPPPDGQAHDPAVGAISCFFFARSVRGQGLSRTFVAEGIRYAKENGTRMLDAHPIEQAKQFKLVGLFVGATAIFGHAGLE